MINLAYLHEPLKHSHALHNFYNAPTNPPLNQTKDNYDYGLAIMCHTYHYNYGKSFDYSVGAFLELLFALGKHGGIAVSYAIHPHLNSASAIAMQYGIPIMPILPQQSLQSARENGIKQFVISLVNDEIFTCNAYEKNHDEFFIIDVSLGLATGIIKPDDIAILDADALLFEGEILGLNRGMGVFLQKTMALFDNQAPIVGLGHAFCTAIDSMREYPNQNMIFWDILSSSIPTLSLFAPLKSLAPNALPLRFKGIKARMLITACAYDDIFIINGRRCLFGLSKPSYVLEALGFCDAEQRELIALSFQSLSMQDMQTIAHILSLRYQQVLTLHS